MTISDSPTAPLVTIVGITGKQGGSVARALIDSDKKYRIRGLTRNAQNPAATAFAALGVELVKVSLTVENKEGVRTAFAGSNIIFVRPSTFRSVVFFVSFSFSRAYVLGHDPV